MEKCYTFTATQVVEITGDVYAESEAEARAIIENIQAEPMQDGKSITFTNIEGMDNFDADINCDSVEVQDIYTDDDEDED